jgi:ribose transport system substrate-binding protein
MRIALLTACLALCLPACGGKSGGGSGSKTIGVTLLSQSQDFYKDLEQGLREEAERAGYHVIVQSGEFDPAIQARQLEDFVTKQVDAVVLCPCDSDTVAASLRPVLKAGIPVFTADIGAKGVEVVAHVASDNTQGGRLAGETMARLLGGTGKVLIIDHPTVSSVQDRTRGFESALEEHPQMSIVARPSAEGQRAKAQSVMEDALTSYPDLAGVFGINDDSALGALRAIEASGREGIVIIGYDATPEARAAIQRGSALKADVVQHPEDIGRKTIQAIQRHFAGETVESWVPVPVGVVDKAALDAR